MQLAGTSLNLIVIMVVSRQLFVLALCLGLGAADYLLPCYYSGNAQYRQGKGRFLPEHYQAGLCTHLFFGFATINPDHSIAVPSDPDSDLTHHNKTGLYDRVNALKLKQPDLKTVLSFGGPLTESWKFSNMVANATKRGAFISTALDLVKSYRFDGIDIAWQTPTVADRTHFATFISELKSAAGDLLVTAVVSGNYKIAKENYDILALSQSLDYVNVLTLDYHGAWERFTGMVSPLYANPGDLRQLTVDYSLAVWSAGGFNNSQILLGISSFGRDWLLDNANNIAIGAAGTVGGLFPITNTAGFGAYFEICDLFPLGAQYWSSYQQVPFLVWGAYWFSYENVQSVQVKMAYVKQKGYAGAFIWPLDFDDFTGSCPGRQQFPLVKAMKYGLSNATDPKPTVKPEQVPTLAPTSAPVPVPSFVCPGNGYYSDLTNCHYYYYCSNGNAYHYACPQDYFWDELKQACLWGNLARCFQKKLEQQPEMDSA